MIARYLIYAGLACLALALVLLAGAVFGYWSLP